MIRQIILKRLGRGLYARYVKDLSFKPSLDTIYSNVLSSLNEHDTEKAISYLIVLMETDINFEPTHHLSKILLFSLSEEFMRKKGHLLKNKNPNLNKYIRSLETDISILEKEIIISQNNISKSETKLLNKFSFKVIFRKNIIISKINQSRNTILNNSEQITKIKKDILLADDLCKVEEYMKITALILEVIHNQERFAKQGFVV